MFKHALSMVLAFLNVKSFAKEDGKSVLSDSQKEQLTEEYGEQFVSKFEADLAKYESSGEDPLRARLEERLTGLDTIVAEQKKTLEQLQGENTTLKGQVAKLVDTPEPEPAAEIVTVNGKRQVKFNVNRNLVHNQIAAAYL